MGEARLTHSDYAADWPKPLQQAARRAVLNDVTAYTPVIIDMSHPKAARQLEELAGSAAITQVIDNYDEQLAELLVSNNAQLYKAPLEVKQHSIAAYLKEHYGARAVWQAGSWVYYPWNGQLVHVLNQELFWELRTIRNKSMISSREQAAFAAIRVGCVGMSVGSNGAAALVLQGGSRQLKIGDGAVLSGSNLNRIRTGVGNVGQNKAAVIARELYEMNPYIELDVTMANIKPAGLADFFTEPWPLDVIVDEIDDLPMKIRLRVEARRRGIPVVMVTDPGDDAMLDVERFDLNPHLPLFHGIAGNIEEVLDKPQLNQREFIKYASMIIGTRNLSVRMQQAMLKVGSALPAAPQLGGTAMFAGAVVAFAVRQLALGAPLKSGRQIVSLEKAFIRGANAPRQRLARRRHARALSRALKSI